MRRALIGHTGFVGSTLATDRTFTDFYNSNNFREMAGQSYDEIVCAGISAVKWRANKEPEQDWQAIQALLDVLSTVETTRFTLISTIDVYPNPSLPQDETEEIQPNAGEPYGRHRLAVERFVMERFGDVVITRLPGLFGKGLKKNIIFDLITGNQTERINPSTVFQWYPLARLPGDLARAKESGLRLVNLFPEPLPTSIILEHLFPTAIIGTPSSPSPCYRLQTVHAGAFGGQGSFIMSAEAVMKALRRFIEEEQIGPILGTV